MRQITKQDIEKQIRDLLALGLSWVPLPPPPETPPEHHARCFQGVNASGGNIITVVSWTDGEFTRYEGMAVTSGFFNVVHLTPELAKEAFLAGEEALK